MIDKSLFKKVTNNFWNCELLPPELFSGKVDPNWYLSSFLLSLPQALRDFTGKSVTVNNWHIGGQLSQRGLRLPESTTGAAWSMHRFALATDVNVEGLSQEEVLDIVVKNRDKFPMVTTYEDIQFTKGWNHFDGRKTDSGILLMVKP